MEIGLRAFVLIADTIQQQKDTNTGQPPQMPPTFTTPSTSTEPISIYLTHQPTNPQTSKKGSSYSQQMLAKNNNDTTNNIIKTTPIDQASINKQRIMLNDSLARELGLSNYFEHIRRIFQDILKTLDVQIGRTFLMTRPENTIPNLASQLESIDSKQTQGVVPNVSNANR